MASLLFGNDTKKIKYLSLAPIEVKILFIFPLKIKRLQRIAGPMTPKKPNLSAPKINNQISLNGHQYFFTMPQNAGIN
jgi:hypothetical protein